jgi:branched-chain amino acid transport system substrate-binding protein
MIRRHQKLLHKIWGVSTFFIVIFLWTAVVFGFQDEGTVRIGVMECLSGRGYSYGLQGNVGRSIGFDEINKAGGVVVNGKKMKIAYKDYSYDTAGAPDQALALARKMKEIDRVLMIGGPTYSSSTEAVFSNLQKKLGDPADKGMEIVVFSSTSTLTGLGKISPWGFRNCIDEFDILDSEMPYFIKAFGPLRTGAGHVTQDDTYSVKMWERIFVPVFEKYGIKIIEKTEGHEKDTDYSTQIMKLRKANPDIWGISANYEAIGRIMAEAFRQGWKPKVALDTISMMAPEIFGIGGKALNGTIFGGVYFWPDAPEVQPMVNEFKKRTGVEMAQHGANAYDGAYMIKWAIENSGIENRPETLERDRRKVRDAFTRIKNFKGIAGVLSMKEGEGDVKRTGGLYILQIQDKKFVPWDYSKYK